MRLIDADKLEFNLRSIYGIAYIGKPCKLQEAWFQATLACIDGMPTAYDVDKVVKQLEDLANEHEYKVKGEPETYSEYNEGWGDCADRAIDIVERGGIDEK